MRFSRTLLAAISLFAVAAQSPATFAQSAPVDDVKVGVLTDMSSVFSDLVGKGSVIAAQMAIDDFVAAEKPDFKVSMISADHTSKADVASNVARQWIDQEGVDVITDIAGASVTLAVSKVGAEKNKIVLATASGQNSLTSEDCQPTALHWTYNTRAVSGTTARAVTKEGGNKWFFITADYAGGRSLQEDATEGVLAEGGEVVGSIKHPFNSQDFSSQLLTAQTSGANVVAFANSGPEFVNGTKQAIEYGINTQAKLVGLLPYVTDIHTLGLEATQGMYVTDPAYWDRNDATRAWSKRFFEKHGKMPTYVQAGLYSGIMHYLKAVKAAGTTDTEAVLAKMREMPINDAFTDNAKLREDNMVVRDMYVYKVKAPADSKGEWDLYEYQYTVPGDQAFRPLSESKCPLLAKNKG
ncbi:ABC transporter substrate-binding protein [Rhodoligotrophos ferricapiens]|uniref:ABC transporter substrate-binding protein n=1 Tax=Rhodoligotrophos ferricapiens TaxID=3069264 RepID=UPI00315D635C